MPNQTHLFANNVSDARSPRWKCFGRWQTSAPAAAIPARMKGKQIIVELLKLNPNTSITGKKFKSQNTKKTSKSARRPGSGLKRGLAATAGAGSDMSTVQLKWLHPSARYKIVDAHLCGCTYSLTILTYVSRKYIEASNMVSLSQSLFLSIMTDDFLWLSRHRSCSEVSLCTDGSSII